MELSEQIERCPKLFWDAFEFLVCEVTVGAFVYELITLSVDGEKKIEMFRVVQFCGGCKFG